MKYVKFSKSAVALSLMMATGTIQAAKYEVTEIPNVEQYKLQFTTGLNDLGEVVGISKDSINFPFYLEEYLTISNTSLRLACSVDDTEAATGEFDAASTLCLRAFLAEPSETYYNSAFYQKIGGVTTYNYANGVTSQSVLLDVVDDEIGELTRSNVEQLNAINNFGTSVGYASAPYQKIDFQQTGESASAEPITIFTQEFQNRAIVYKNNEVSVIEPLDASYGGFSYATSITDNNYVSGYESVEVYDLAQQNITSACDGELLPVNTCAWGYSRSSNIYEIRPVVWKIDDNGDVLEAVRYDLNFTPSDTQLSNYGAYATSVNEQGIAVGYGTVEKDNENYLVTLPLIYKDGETIEMLADDDGFDRGYALDINSSNQVVGYLQTFFDSQYNDQFFIYDINTGELSIPEGFYKSAQTTAAAINDNGLVVGVSEYELTTSQNRRKHAFLYDTNTQELTNLNDLVSCESGYEIVEVSGINNNNQITANATKTVDNTDSKGNVVLDDNGNPEQTTTIVAVLLDPISGGQVESCSTEEDDGYERRGMSMSYWLLASLSFFAVIRRRFI